MTDAAVTFDLADALGVDYNFSRTKLWVEFNTENKRVTDADGQIRLGAGVVIPDADGTGTITGIPIPSGSTNPTSFQVKIHYDAPPKVPGVKDRIQGDFGWMTITANTDLSALEEEQYAPPEYQGAFVADLEALRDDVEAFRDSATSEADRAENAADAAVDISGISTSDGVVEALVKNTAGAGPLTSAAIAAIAMPDSRLLDFEGQFRGIVDALKKESGYGTSLGTWTSAATTISGGVDVDPIVNPFGSYSLNQVFTYVGATPDRVNSGYPGQVCVGGLGLTSTATMLIPRPIFVHSGAQVFETKVFAQGGTYNARLRVWLLSVFGMVCINNTPIDGPGGGGSLYRIRVALPDAGEHIVLLENSGLTCWWNGITRDPAATVRRYTGPIGETIIGPNLDSLGEGQNGRPNKIGNPLGYFPTIFRALGVLDYRVPALGETAVIADGADHDRANGVTRFADDVLARNPQRVPFFGSQNDSAYTKAAVKAGLHSELDDLDGPPGFPLTSNIQPRSGNGLTVVRDAYKEVAEERGLPFIDATTFLTGAGFMNLTVTDAVTTNGSPTLDSATALFNSNHVGHPISGAGIPGGTTILAFIDTDTVTLSNNATATATGVSITVTNVTGDGGNADRYLGPDGAHLSDEGHEEFAIWWLARYKAGYCEPGLAA